MNLKIKKRVISMLCATVMVASSMGASVGAIKIVPSCTQKSKDAVLKSNQTLECSTAGLMKLNDNIQKLKLNNQNNDEVSNKLEDIIAKLSGAINKIKSWNNYYIANEDVVVKIQNEITNLNDQITQLNSKCLSEEPNWVIQNSTNIFNKIETINNKLLEENRKVLFKKELDDKNTEYCRRAEEFLKWKADNNISQESDTTRENMLNVLRYHLGSSLRYYLYNSEKVNAGVLEEFSKLAKKSCEEMEEFKKRKSLFWRELDDKYKEYRRRVEEFCTWRASNNISSLGLRTIYNNISYVETYYRSIRPNANAGVVNQFSELATKSCEEMEEFKNRILARQRFMRNMLMQKIHFIWLR